MKSLKDLQCSDITSPMYKDLCQTLSQPIIRETAITRAFTNLPATDLLILMELSDEDLISTCASNKYLNNLCQNESFWLNRTMKRFGYLGTPQEINRKYIPDGTSWKDYYLWLSDITANPDVHVVYNFAIEYNREDVLLVLDHELKERALIPTMLNVGYFNPLKLNDNLQNFLKEADLGLSDPNNPDSIPLNKILFGSISNRANLTLIFTIYIKKKGLERDRLCSDSLITKYFKESCQKISRDLMQKIISDNTKSILDISDEFLKSQIVLDRLQIENRVLRVLIGYYR